MVQTLQKTVEVQQVQAFAVVDVAVFSQRQVPGSSGGAQTCSSTRCSSSEEEDFAAFCGIFRTPSGWT